VPRDLARLAQVLALGVNPQARGEELLAQSLGPAAIRQALLRRLSDEAWDQAVGGRHGGGAYASSSSVTGPSLTSSTAISAPNSPCLAPSRSQNRWYRGSATAAAAAAT
jgi:hypothetical protein